MQRKFGKVQVEDENIRCMVQSTCKTLQAANYALDAPITMEDLYFAVKKGKHPAPGSDAMRHDFNFTWGTIKKTC